MNPAPEEFDELRKLLVLKRHEQPPPGFFNHFSDKVIGRIEAEGLFRRASWWQRLFPSLDAKPGSVAIMNFGGGYKKLQWGSLAGLGVVMTLPVIVFVTTYDLASQAQARY